jgi:hypothetical protein
MCFDMQRSEIGRQLFPPYVGKGRVVMCGRVVGDRGLV